MEFTGVLTALRHSHERLVGALTPLSAAQAAGPSYCEDWTIGQVASHLGSGAEIFGLMIEAGLKQAPAPGMDEFQPIWQAWDGKPAPQQVADGIRADAALLDRAAAVSPAERESWRLEFFGAERTLADLLGMRLSEHAVHTWDVVVALDPAATLATDAVTLMLEFLPGFAGMAAKGDSEPATVHITTRDPDRQFLLELRQGETEFGPVPAPVPAGAATLSLPAEALVRLIYGRLDPEHTPASVQSAGVGLGTLRRRFPGV